MLHSQQTISLNAPGEGVPERPRLAPNVQLIGKMKETGFTDQQWLIQRDGKFIQITELLYRVAELANGENTHEEIAEALTKSTDWIVTADQARKLVQKLIPLGLLASADGTAPPVLKQEQRSSLQINLRKNVVGPEKIEPITRVLQFLFAPPILIPLLVLAAIAHVWFYFIHGPANSIRQTLYTPGGLLLTLGLAILSGIFHELGHAAALRYGGGKVRGMGVGFYLVYPTLYTDVTDSYRLGRWDRLRTDLGGIYFHLLFVIGIIALYFITGQEVLLAVIMIINADILYQLIPYVRLDGYWALADLTGIPDFFSQMGPFMASLLPVPSQEGDRLPPLKRWVKVVFLAYILLTIPVLTLFGIIFVVNFPRLVSIGWDAILFQARSFSIAWSAGEYLAVVAIASQILILSLSVLATVYFLYRLLRDAVRTIWKWSRPTPLRRIGGALVATSGLALIALLWAPELLSLPLNIPEGVQRYEVTERNHVQSAVDYPQSPPVGGNHAPVWQNCGFYSTPIGNENAVHSMEHGAVWITYRPDLPEEQVDRLRQLGKNQTYILVSPYPQLASPVVVSAWGHQLALETATDPRLQSFVRAFRLGRQAPERGGDCTGGFGSPE